MGPGSWGGQLGPGSWGHPLSGATGSWADVRAAGATPGSGGHPSSDLSDATVVLTESTAGKRLVAFRSTFGLPNTAGATEHSGGHPLSNATTVLTEGTVGKRLVSLDSTLGLPVASRLSARVELHSRRRTRIPDRIMWGTKFLSQCTVTQGHPLFTGLCR